MAKVIPSNRRCPVFSLRSSFRILRGVDLFRATCENDLEGIVAKLAHGTYDPDATTWVKIKNRGYSQMEGRRELFERKRA